MRVRFNVVPTVKGTFDMPETDRPRTALNVPKYDGRRGPSFTAWNLLLLDAAYGRGDQDAS